MAGSGDDVHFEGSGDPDVVAFLFSVENYVTAGRSEVRRASAVMMRLRGRAFRWFFNNLAGGCLLREDGKSYSIVKSAKLEGFSETDEASTRVDEAIALRPSKGESMRRFKRKADNLYKGARLSPKQAFHFLSRAATGTLELRNVVFLHAPTTYEQLKKTLIDYEESVRRFDGGSYARRDGHVHEGRGSAKDARADEGPKDAIEKELAEISLMMKRHRRDGGG